MSGGVRGQPAADRVYTGSLSAKRCPSTELFYTNTLDLTLVEDIGLADYGDALTMAAYVKSEDVSFYDLAADRLSAVTEYIATVDEDTLTSIFESAGFPPRRRRRMAGILQL